VKLNRREFLLLSTGLMAGCQATQEDTSTAPGKSREINAGAVSRFNADGVYSEFRSRGFFIIRQGGKLFALSAICTHRKCKLTAQRDHSFVCPCHGSTFDAGGHVTEGPAVRDLPVLPTNVNEQGQLLVTI